MSDHIKTAGTQLANVPASQIDDVNERHQRIHGATRKLVEMAAELGDKLRAMKANIGHGGWETFVEERLDFGLTRAKLYMRAAENREALLLEADRGDLGASMRAISDRLTTSQPMISGTSPYPLTLFPLTISPGDPVADAVLHLPPEERLEAADRVYASLDDDGKRAHIEHNLGTWTHMLYWDRREMDPEDWREHRDWCLRGRITTEEVERWLDSLELVKVDGHTTHWRLSGAAGRHWVLECPIRVFHDDDWRLFEAAA